MHNAKCGSTQVIGTAAFARGLAGVLAPSATRLGDNLILFTDHLGAGSTIVLLSSRDPRLYVERHRG
jgi:hypothetical protein